MKRLIAAAGALLILAAGTAQSYSADAFATVTFTQYLFSGGSVIGPVPFLRNWPNATDNLAFFSGKGARLSYCSLMERCDSGPGVKTTDTTYVQGALRMTSQQPAEIAEYTLSLDTFINSGFADVWTAGRTYAVGDRVTANGSMYRAASAGVAGRTPPDGTGASHDGGVSWAYVGLAAQDNKVGLNHLVQVGAGAGHSWGSAMNTIILPGARTRFAVNDEHDLGVYARPCLSRMQCYNLWLYGITTYPATAQLAISTPEGTPAVGVPAAWAPNTAYAITASGAPIVKNGANYYYLLQGGRSAASGGPTGTAPDTDIDDGSAKWRWYDPEPMSTGNGTSPYLGGASGAALLLQGKNLAREAAIALATGGRYGINVDAGATHGSAAIGDYSTSAVSYLPGGTYSYATINDTSRAPWGHIYDGAYSAGAWKFKDLMAGLWGGNAGYSALSFNGTFAAGENVGFFGKSGESVLYGNVPANGMYQFRIGATTALQASLSNLLVAGSITMGHATVATLPACSSANQDMMIVVTDATAPITYRGTLTGGGTVRTPAYCDGSSWTAH